MGEATEKEAYETQNGVPHQAIADMEARRRKQRAKSEHEKRGETQIEAAPQHRDFGVPPSEFLTPPSQR